MKIILQSRDRFFPSTSDKKGTLVGEINRKRVLASGEKVFDFATENELYISTRRRLNV